MCGKRITFGVVFPFVIQNTEYRPPSDICNKIMRNMYYLEKLWLFAYLSHISKIHLNLCTNTYCLDGLWRYHLRYSVCGVCNYKFTLKQQTNNLWLPANRYSYSPPSLHFPINENKNGEMLLVVDTIFSFRKK